MLLYNGVRISEFLDLKKENVHLDEQYFDVISSKTRNASILSIHRMASTSNTEIIMTATSIHWWNNLRLTAHHIVADTHVFQC